MYKKVISITLLLLCSPSIVKYVRKSRKKAERRRRDIKTFMFFDLLDDLFLKITKECEGVHILTR